MILRRPPILSSEVQRSIRTVQAGLRVQPLAEPDRSPTWEPPESTPPVPRLSEATAPREGSILARKPALLTGGIQISAAWSPLDACGPVQKTG